MKKLLFLLLIPVSLFSQTLTFNPGKDLDPNDPVEIIFTVDSALNYYPIEDLQSDPIKLNIISLEVVGILLVPNPENELAKIARIQGENFIDKLDENQKSITLTQEDENELIFSFKSEKNYFEFFGLKNEESLENIGFEIDLNNWRYYSNQPFFNNNTNNQKGYHCVGKECYVFFKVNINKSNVINTVDISNQILNNVDSLLKLSTSDINLIVREDCGSPSENCDRWIGNAPIYLSDPIVQDFTGDNISDIAAKVYSHYFGDIDWELTDEEKKMYFSRWVLFEGVNDQDSLVFNIKGSYDQVNEGVKLVSLDYDNDGDLDIYTIPGVFHGSQNNKPLNWSGDEKLFLNDGSGNFTEVEFNNSIRLQYINQYDEDIENEIIYVTNKFDSRYQTENEAKIVFIDKIDDSFVETKSDDIFITPETGKGIFTRTINKFISHDVNNDGFKDIVVWFEQTEANSESFNQNGKFILENFQATSIGMKMRRFFIVFNGSDSGFDLSWPSSNSYVLKEYETFLYEPYEAKILNISENKNIILTLDIQSQATNIENGLAVNSEPLSILTAFELSDLNLNDITETIFPNNQSKNYLDSSNEFKFKDIDGDGLDDIYFWQGQWFTDSLTLPFNFFINKGDHFEPFHFTSFFSGGPPLNDYNSDNKSELDFDGDLGRSFGFAHDVNILKFYEGGELKKEYEPIKNLIFNLVFDTDDDGDGVEDTDDNCPLTANPDGKKIMIETWRSSYVYKSISIYIC